MCIGCRTRLAQSDMLRLSCQDRELQKYNGFGRSFYLCEGCIQKGEKVIKKALSKACKKEIKINILEKILNG
jgi:predicted RNA-binding protein YlxR (DUF448 family)